MKIVLSAVVALFLVACSNNDESSQTKVESQKSVKTEKSVVEKKIKKEVIKKEVPAVEVAPIKTEVVPKEIAKIVDGAQVFTKCTACHGKKAEKKALNKSHIIQGWSSEKIQTALHGYKNGTYGSSMKSVMKAQVSDFSDAEIKAVADYIASIKK